MEKEQWIPVEDFCTAYKIEISFVHSLKESGLIELDTTAERASIPSHQLADLERFMRLHYDLDINIEGIETISYLLQRIRNMQHEINLLRNSIQAEDRFIS